MKINTKTFLLILCLSSFVGFSTGDEVELDAFLNARSSANFSKKSKNLATTLTKGTTGKVLEIKNFPSSGNSGIKMKITNGPNSGESYWVYYNKKDPGLKLINRDKKEIKPDVAELKSTGETKEDISAEALRDINGTPETEIETETEKEKEIINQAVLTAIDILKQDSIQNLTSPEPIKCDQIGPFTPSLTPVSDIVQLNSLKDFDETVVQAPFRENLDQNSLKYLTSCRLKSYWELCHNPDLNNEPVPVSFIINNLGGNSIGSIPETRRKFDFSFQGASRSDMSLKIYDYPSDGYTSHIHAKMITFFPREVMPAIRLSDTEDVLIVTLPTREEVRFNSKTKEILSGPLTEGPITQGPRGHAEEPNVQYTGSGVIVESSAVGTSAVGHQGKRSDHKKTVAIKKKGHKTCTVPEVDLWESYKLNNGLWDTKFVKEYASNTAFDGYVKKKCGFSIY